LIALMARSSARHGLRLHLAAPPMELKLALAQMAPSSAYRIHSTAPAAIRTLTGITRPERTAGTERNRHDWRRPSRAI
jgi:hypothetical protein